MLGPLGDLPCRILDHDSSWWGIRRLKPAPHSPYSSRTLLLVCVAYGIPVAAITYGAAYLALSAADPFGHLRMWLPRASAWAAFVVNGLLQAFGRWLWNRRAFKLNPAAIRRVRSAG